MIPGMSLGNIPGQRGMSKISRNTTKKGTNARNMTAIARDNLNLDSMLRNEIKNNGVAI